MIFSNEDKISIKALRYEKGYWARKLIYECLLRLGPHWRQSRLRQCRMRLCDFVDFDFIALLSLFCRCFVESRLSLARSISSNNCRTSANRQLIWIFMSHVIIQSLVASFRSCLVRNSTAHSALVEHSSYRSLELLQNGQRTHLNSPMW